MSEARWFLAGLDAYGWTLLLLVGALLAHCASGLFLDRRTRP